MWACLYKVSQPEISLARAEDLCSILQFQLYDCGNNSLVQINSNLFIHRFNRMKIPYYLILILNKNVEVVANYMLKKKQSLA